MLSKKMAGVLLADSSSVYSETTNQVQKEIALAFHVHKMRQRIAKGLILGINKYRQLNLQLLPISSANPEAGLHAYNGVEIIVDGSQPNRISVF